MISGRIGRYQILKPLGQGGMGKVFLAHDPELERQVVIKLINLPASDHRSLARQRFRREVQAAGQFNHRHIVTVYDVDLAHDPPYVVMELLRGDTLKQKLVTDGPFSWRETLNLLRPLAEALAYAHRLGIVHRDVKPANIMFAGDVEQTLKLVDFGLAYWPDNPDQLTHSGSFSGTPAYMAPELATDAKVDGRADIFAFGLILFEAMVGRNPLDRGAFYPTLSATFSPQPVDTTPLRHCAPPPVIRLVEACIAKDPNERYPHVEAMLLDLDNCLQLPQAEDGETPSIVVSQANLPAHLRSRGPAIQTGPNIELDDDIEAVLRAMFHDFTQVAVEARFGGGYSGSLVFQVRLVKNGSRVYLPAVIKIAEQSLIREEAAAYQDRVKGTLPNIARLEAPPAFPASSRLGGLQYALVGGGTFEVESLRTYYQRTTETAVRWILENRLFRIMGPNWWLDNRADRTFQMQTDYDRLLPVNLLLRPITPLKDAPVQTITADRVPNRPLTLGSWVNLKGMIIDRIRPDRSELTLNFPPTMTDRRLLADHIPPVSFRVRLEQVPDIDRYQQDMAIDSLFGEVTATRHTLLTNYARRTLAGAVDLNSERLLLSTGISLPNPLWMYQAMLYDFLPVKISTVHGDLNTENILVDAQTRDVSLIDFATVREGHAIHDLLRLETEVMVMFLPPLLAAAALPVPETVYTFYEQLHQATFRHDWQLHPQLPAPALYKPFAILLTVRRMARNCLFNPDDWEEYYRGLTLYLLGALKLKGLDPLATAPLPKQVAFWGAAVVQHLLEIPAPSEALPFEIPPPPQIDDMPAHAGPVFASVTQMENPYGTMPSDSPFYIERQADYDCWRELIGATAATLSVQAPRQMGKSSLLSRISGQADKRLQRQAAIIDFQKIPEKYFQDEHAFYQEFGLMIGDALGVPEAIDRHWRSSRATINNCSRYLSDHIIPQVDGPFILALDEVENMLVSDFRSDFFGMLRAWHNDRAIDDRFARMTLFLSSSTEPYLLIDNPHQSPFNVATPLVLQDFTVAEVQELNRRHGTPLTDPQIEQLVDLLAGHPFLTRVALYELVTGKVTPQQLFSSATLDSGPFGNHLRYYLQLVLQKPALRETLEQVLHHQAGPNHSLIYRLEAAGLIKRQGSEIVLRNKLYARYFEEHLDA